MMLYISVRNMVYMPNYHTQLCGKFTQLNLHWQMENSIIMIIVLLVCVAKHPPLIYTHAHTARQIAYATM